MKERRLQWVGTIDLPKGQQAAPGLPGKSTGSFADRAMFLGFVGIARGLVLVASMIFAPVGAIMAVFGGISLVVGCACKLFKRASP